MKYIINFHPIELEQAVMLINFSIWWCFALSGRILFYFTKMAPHSEKWPEMSATGQRLFFSISEPNLMEKDARDVFKKIILKWRKISIYLTINPLNVLWPAWNLEYRNGCQEWLRAKMCYYLPFFDVKGIYLLVPVIGM
jgi:hypothetical protein